MNSWRIYCAKCGDMIGVWPDDFHNLVERKNVYPMVLCPGRGNHSKPHEISLQIHWGIVEEFFICYPETHTRERAYRYIGPAWWPIVAIAFCVIVKKNIREEFKKVRMGGKTIFWLPHRPSFWRKFKKFVSVQKFRFPRNHD